MLIRSGNIVWLIVSIATVQLRMSTSNSVPSSPLPVPTIKREFASTQEWYRSTHDDVSINPVWASHGEDAMDQKVHNTEKIADNSS